MAKAKANCAICSKPIVYHQDASPVTCITCGKEEMAKCVCEDGHYVCDACHRENGVRHIIETCVSAESSDPIEIAIFIMKDDSIYPNGPEHHSLVGAVLLTAFKNAGGEIDLESALDELVERSVQVPGGTCGYWGCCGAAISAGQFYSIISGSTPLNEEEWGKCARLTSRIMGRLADIGGPRCCKRTSFVSIEEAAKYTAETMHVEMKLPEKTKCSFQMGNAQCKGRDCPYF